MKVSLILSQNQCLKRCTFFLEHPARVFTKFALIKDTDETIQTELFTERI